MQSRQPYHCLIYAHRGARKAAADNTRLAFDKALHFAIDGIETDVQLTRDEVSVLWHDRFLDKLGFPDKRIDDFTYQELQGMNFASYFNPADIENVCSLKEFIDTYRSQCRLQIEIKNRDWEEPGRQQLKMRQCLAFLGASENLDVFISSFNLACLSYAQQLGTKIPLVFAFREIHKLTDVEYTLKQHPFLAGLCHPISTLNEAIVRLLRKNDKTIVTYTCNSKPEIQKALALQVDILITDDPQKALQIRG